MDSEATALDKGGIANAVTVGKLFVRNFALSVQYTRGPVFVIDPTKDETEHLEQWVIGLHIPFSYRD